MVLHLGQDDEIARLEIGARPGIRDEVDRLGGIARVNNLAGGRRVDKFRDLFARIFVQRGGFFGQRVNAAMDIGVRAAIKIVHRLDNGNGLLRCGRGIEIDQAHAGPRLALEDGKVTANFFNVEHGEPV